MAKHLRLARELRSEPRVIVPRMRGWIANLWQARGGGFYGLGYVVTFVTFEIRSLTGSFVGSASVSEFVSEFITQQALQLVLRFSLESLFNVFLAVLWPLYLLSWLGGWGVLALAAGFLGFERLLRPLIERWFPELRAAREAQARLREEKKARKRRKRERKGDSQRHDP